MVQFRHFYASAEVRADGCVACLDPLDVFKGTSANGLVFRDQLAQEKRTAQLLHLGPLALGQTNTVGAELLRWTWAWHVSIPFGAPDLAL